jgi:hypothetical protein
MGKNGDALPETKKAAGAPKPNLKSLVISTTIFGKTNR